MGWWARRESNIASSLLGRQRGSYLDCLTKHFEKGVCRKLSASSRSNATQKATEERARLDIRDKILPMVSGCTETQTKDLMNYAHIQRTSKAPTELCLSVHPRSTIITSTVLFCLPDSESLMPCLTLPRLRRLGCLG